LLLGAEAKVLGRGGIKVVAAAIGAHPDTVAQGVRELDYPDGIAGRVRRPAVRPGPRQRFWTPRCARRWMRWWIR